MSGPVPKTPCDHGNHVFCTLACACLCHDEGAQHFVDAVVAFESRRLDAELAAFLTGTQ